MKTQELVQQETVLKDELKAILANWFKNYTSQKPCPSIGFGLETYEQVKDQVFSDLVDDFMQGKFGNEWQDNDKAQAFYENIACDLRGDAEYDMQEWIDNFGEYSEKVTITNMTTETVDQNLSFVVVQYIGRNGEENEIYLNLDMSETCTELQRQAQIVTSCFTDEDQAQFKALVTSVEDEKILGFTPINRTGESIFGCSLADWGVYKYTANDGRVAVVVHKYYKDFDLNSKSKRFDSEQEFQAWYQEMVQYDQYGDANITHRAINDIENLDDQF